MELPFFDENKITYKEIELSFPPGPSIPISNLDTQKRGVALK